MADIPIGTPNPLNTPNFNTVTPSFNSKRENDDLETMKKLGRFGLKS